MEMDFLICIRLQQDSLCTESLSAVFPSTVSLSTLFFLFNVLLLCSIKSLQFHLEIHKLQRNSHIVFQAESEK